MNNLNPIANAFEFSELEVRTAIDEKHKPWFCAKDVCKSLDITWNGSSIKSIPEEWVTMLKLSTVKGEKDTVFIDESGLFHLVLRSNKPKAREFSNWICGTVLPEIRHYGHFGVIKVSDMISISKQIDSLSDQIIKTKNAYRRKLLSDQLRKLCNLVNQPIPPTEWIALDFDQTDLFEAAL